MSMMKDYHVKVTTPGAMKHRTLDELDSHLQRSLQVYAKEDKFHSIKIEWTEFEEWREGEASINVCGTSAI